MYSCNVPVPSAVSRLARGLASEAFRATPRDRHTLLVKRLGEGDPGTLARSVREAVEGIPPFAVSVTGVDVFENPPTGTAPVAYLAVESAELGRLHRALCAEFDPVEELEGDDYVPHVTVARGGDAGDLAGRAVDHEWSVETLLLWSGDYGEPVERISLPV